MSIEHIQPTDATKENGDASAFTFSMSVDGYGQATLAGSQPFLRDAREAVSLLTMVLLAQHIRRETAKGRSPDDIQREFLGQFNSQFAAAVKQASDKPDEQAEVSVRVGDDAAPAPRQPDAAAVNAELAPQIKGIAAIPWSLDVEHTSNGHPVIRSLGSANVTAGPLGYVLAEIFKLNGSDEATANGCLMAAAPDLYAACQIAHDRADLDPESFCKKHKLAWKKEYAWEADRDAEGAQEQAADTFLLDTLEAALTKARPTA
jgi:hypothetical protein